MNTSNTIRISTDLDTDTPCHAAITGALVWGTVYSTATTGATCAVASMTDAEPLKMSHVFAETIAMFYPYGMVRGLIMWYVRNGGRPGNRSTLRGIWLRRFTPGRWNRV